jgi:hypothetical protein
VSTFELIDAKGEPSGVFRLRYGSGPNDPMPFILTLMPSYVAHELSKTLPITLQDIQEYAKRNAHKLKAIAQRVKDSGRNTEVLQ